MKRIKESSRKNGRRALVVPSVVLLLIAGYLQIPASVWQMFEPRVAAVTFSSTTTNEGDINTIAGNGVQGFSGDGGAPLDAALFDPHGIAVAPDGTIYFGDSGNFRIRKIDTAGVISTIAGTGVADDTGDGGLAIDATVSLILSIALDPVSNTLYFTDVNNNRVRRIDLTTGTIHAFAGTGTIGFQGDGGAAILARLRRTQGIAVAPDGSVVIADTGNCRIRRISGGIITTIAGSGVCESLGDGLPATSAGFYFPRRLNVDDDGNIFVVDDNNLSNDNNTIRRIDAVTGVIDVVAGGGATIPGTGPATTMKIGNVSDITFDALGNLYIGSIDRAYRVDLTSGVLCPFAGTGAFGFSGDGGPAIDAEFFIINAIAFRGETIIISDGGNNRLRAVNPVATPEPTPTPIVNTIAGNGAQGYSGDGGPALDTALFNPGGIAVAPDGTIYFADTQNFRIRKIDTAGVITTIAGTGIEGNDGANGEPATSVSFSMILTIALDPSTGSLYICDVFANRILRVDLAAGTIHHFAGTGIPAYSDGPAFSAGVTFPEGVAVGPDGSLFIADTGNCRIRQVTAGIMTTIAGSNVCDPLGDGGPAASSSLRFPRRVYVGANGDVFIGDGSFSNHDDTVRRIDVSTGLIDRVAGGGATTPGSGVATAMDIGSVSDITSDALGNLYISSITRVFRVNLASGLLSPYAGTGVEGFSGDGGPAIDATFYGITALAFKGTALVIADGQNNRLRAVNYGPAPTPTPTPTATPTPTPTPIPTPFSCAQVGNAPTAIVGDLVIDGPTATTINLACVTSVSGNLVLTNQNQAGVLDLGSLTTVGGNLIISNNSAAGDLDLGSLAAVSGNLELVNNPAAGNLDLSSLGTVSGNLLIAGSQGSGDLDLGSLTSVGGAVNIAENATSGEVDLSSLTSTGGAVNIAENATSGELDLSSLTSTGGTFRIASHPSASVIRMGALGTVAGSVDISGNSAVSAISMGSLNTVAGDVTIEDNGSAGTVDLAALQTAGVISIGGNTAAGTVDLGSLGTAGEVKITNNGAAEVTLDLTTVSGDVTIDSSGTGTFSIGDGSVAGEVDLDLTGYTSVSGSTAGGETSVSNATTEAVMSVQLADGAFTTPVSFSITHQDPATLVPADGTSSNGTPGIVDPVAAYQFTFGVPTLNQDASLTFDVLLDGLDASTRTALLEALANGQATLATRGDAPGSAYQAFPICSAGQSPTLDGCVLVETLDATGQPTTGTPAIIRFSNVVGHFSSWAVVIFTPDTDGDGISDVTDNCPADANPDQLDTDADGFGNVCDADDDGDGVPDVSDAFPLDPQEWVDTDSDGIGNNADPDDDNDGHSDSNETAAGSDSLNAQSTPEVCDGVDNDLNDGVDEGFANTDGDSMADCVDPDDDNDGVLDAADLCAGTPAGTQVNAAGCPDADGDGVADSSDNCTMVPNPDQADSDGDGIGNACDTSQYNFTGFFQPVENLPTLNIATAGSGIPLKFSLGGFHGLGIFAPGFPSSGEVQCSAHEPGDTIEETVNTGGSSLSYDPGTDRYIYVWKTNKAWKGTCRFLIVRFNDGTERYAKFRFR